MFTTHMASSLKMLLSLLQKMRRDQTLPDMLKNILSSKIFTVKAAKMHKNVLLLLFVYVIFAIAGQMMLYDSKEQAFLSNS